MLLNRNTISTFMLLSLSFVLLIGATVSEFFQAPILSSKELSKLQYLFTQKDIEKIKSLTINSGLGTFDLTLSDTGHWALTAPRSIDANSKIIESILTSLKKIKIKKIYPKDAINLANFSLDKPISKVTLTNQRGNSKTISFGLINPIDNSTYVTLDKDKAIYHVNFVDMPLEKLELSSLIDSRIFNMDWSDIKSFKIVGDNKSTRLNFKKVSKKWMAASRELNEIKIKSYLKRIVAIKSHIILDKKSPKLIQRLERYLKRPFLTVFLNTNSGEKISYKISYIINTLPEIKMEKKAHFIIEASNRQHPYLVNKSYMTLFYKKVSSFKPLPIKKLIY